MSSLSVKNCQYRTYGNHKIVNI